MCSSDLILPRDVFDELGIGLKALLFFFQHFDFVVLVVDPTQQFIALALHTTHLRHLRRDRHKSRCDNEYERHKQRRPCDDGKQYVHVVNPGQANGPNNSVILNTLLPQKSMGF